MLIVREHVLAGRSFDSLAELDGTFGQWLLIRRGQVHRTHGEVISIRAERDRTALARRCLSCPPWSPTGTYAGSGRTASLAVPAKRFAPGSRSSGGDADAGEGEIGLAHRTQ